MGTLWLDVEVYADHEEEIQALFAELAEEKAEHEVPRRDDELPPIIQDEVPEWDTWGEAA